MESLVALSREVGVTQVEISPAETVLIRTLSVKFGGASPPYLRSGALPDTYTSKPLVSVAGDGMFGELAIVRVLERDGWDAVWVDTFHNRRFWRAMPHKSEPVELPHAVRARYDTIVRANAGKASGFFDVLAWRADEFAFLEYRGPGDTANRNERRWLSAALGAGVVPSELWYVIHADGHSDDYAPRN